MEDIDLLENAKICVLGETLLLGLMCGLGRGDAVEEKKCRRRIIDVGRYLNENILMEVKNK